MNVPRRRSLDSIAGGATAYIVELSNVAVVVLVVIVAWVLAALGKISSEVTSGVLLGAVGWAGGHAVGYRRGGHTESNGNP